MAKRFKRCALRVEAGEFTTGPRQYSQRNVTEEYLAKIIGHIKLTRPIKLVVDCGNGAPGAYAPDLFRRTRLRSDRIILRSRRQFSRIIIPIPPMWKIYKMSFAH